VAGYGRATSCASDCLQIEQRNPAIHYHNHHEVAGGVWSMPEKYIYFAPKDWVFAVV
jgi:hypothetical protein